MIFFFTSDNSDYHSSSELFENNLKIGCIDSCCNNTKTCLVLSKSKEQENLLITLIPKIENPELKEEYLKKLKKTMIKDINKPAKAKISLDKLWKDFLNKNPNKLLSQICSMRLVILRKKLSI